MSKKKQGGKTNQNVRRAGKRLGLKISDGQTVSAGSILIRQRGTVYTTGEGVDLGRDHTIFATKTGKVKFAKKLGKTIVSVI